MTDTSRSLRIEQGGLCATVQDLGRPGYRDLGVAVGGACDRRAAAAANLLVGNAPESAVLEITWHGTAWQFTAPTLAALCGGDLAATCGTAPFPIDRAVLVPAGVTVRCWGAERGNFAYLAVAGGIAVPTVLGGQGTHLQSGFGGWDGRAVRGGDVLPLGPLTNRNRALAALLAAEPSQAAGQAARWGLGSDLSVHGGSPAPLRILPGPHWDQLQPASHRALLESTFKVTAELSRMGFRLAGTPLRFAAPQEIPSLPTVPGTLQLPAGGNPIALMADAAPTGGYPQIAYIIAADLPRLAQADVGRSLRFELVDWDEAARAAAAAANDLRRLQAAIDLRLGTHGEPG